MPGSLGFLVVGRVGIAVVIPVVAVAGVAEELKFITTHAPAIMYLPVVSVKEAVVAAMEPIPVMREGMDSY